MFVRPFAAVTLLAAAATLTTPARAHDGNRGDIELKHAWARASLGTIGAAYVTISIRGGNQGDRLIRVSSPAAGKVEIHTHLMDKQGIARMRQVPGVDIRPGRPTVFRPGGLHLMLFGLKAPLKKGGTLPLDLTFRHAGTVRVTAVVLGIGARGPSGGQNRHKHH